MAPIAGLVIAGVGWWLARKTQVLGPVFPSAAIIPDIRGKSIPAPTLSKTNVPNTKAVEYYQYRFIVGSSGYFVAVAKHDKDTWLAYTRASDTGPSILVNSRGNKATVQVLAANFKLPVG
jgi:hypothetical protein